MSLGRAAVDLDADLSKLEAKLREGESITRAWINAITATVPTLDVDASAAAQEIDDITATLSSLDQSSVTPQVGVDTGEADTRLTALEQALADIDAQIATARVNGETEEAIAELVELRNHLAVLSGEPTVVQVQANTEQATQGLGDIEQLLDGLPVKAVAGSAVIAGAIAFTLDAYKQVDAAQDSIRIGTGQTGESLQALEADFESIAKTAPNALGDAALAVSDLNRRLDLSGEPLREMSQQFLALNRLIGGDLQKQIALGTRLFGDWTVATHDQGEALDFVFKVSQQTGVGVERLMQQVVDFGAPLRAMGFGLEESLAILGQFEKQGVRAELVLSGLRQALRKFADEGVDDPNAALKELIESIQTAGSEGESNQIALKYFGRAGIDMGVAIREGRLDVDALVTSLDASEETILSAAEATDDAAESFAILKNQAVLATGVLAGELAPSLVEILELGIAISELELPSWMGGGSAGSNFGDGVKFAAFGPLGLGLEAAGTASGFLNDLIGTTDDAAASQAGWNAMLAEGQTHLQVFGSAVQDVVAAVQADHGITVTATDLKRGFIVTTNGQTIALTGYIQAAILANQAGSETAVVMADFAAEVGKLLTLSFDGGIGVLPDLLTAIGAGFITSEDAAQAMASSMGGDFDAIREAATQMRGSLVDAQLAAILSGDAEAADELSIRIQSLDAFVAALAGTVIMLPPPMDEMATSTTNAADATRDMANAAGEAQAATTDWMAVQGLVDANVNRAAESIGYWEKNLSETERALGILNEQIERGEPLSERQQEQYDTLTWGAERLQGGIHELEGGFVDAATAQVTFMQKQDDLNGALANGEISQEQYNEAIATARSEMNSALGPSGELANSQQILADTVGGVIDKLRDLLIELGIIDGASAEPDVTLETTLFDRGAELVEGDIIQLNSAKATPSADLNTSPFDQNMGDALLTLDEFAAKNPTTTATADTATAQSNVDALIIRIDGVPQSFTIDAYANIAPAMEAIATLRNNMPFSPAKEGPFKTLPNWAWIFTGLDTAAEDYTARVAASFSGMLGDISALATGETLEDAKAALADLLSAQGIAAELGLGDAVITGLQADIDAARERVAAIGAVMGTSVVQGIASAIAGEVAAEELTVAMEEAAEAAAEALEAGGSRALGIMSGTLVAGAKEAMEEAQAVLEFAIANDWPEAQIAALEVMRDKSANDYVNILGELGNAAAAGLVSDEVMREWGMAAEELFQIPIDTLAALLPEMRDGGESLIGELAEGAATGAASFEDVLGILRQMNEYALDDLVETTGLAVEDIVAELEALEAELIDELAQALLSGTDPDGISSNIDAIRALLAELRGDIVETVATIDRVVGRSISGRGTYTPPAEPEAVTLKTLLAGEFGFGLSPAALGDAIAGKFEDLELTQLDEQLALLKQIDSNLDMFGGEGTLIHAFDQFEAALKEQGLLELSQLDHINQELLSVGLQPMMSLPALMSDSVGEAIVNSAETTGRIIAEQIDQRMARWMPENGFNRSVETTVMRFPKGRI